MELPPDDDADMDEAPTLPAVDLDTGAGTHSRELGPPAPGRTLLPGTIARAVSFATRSTTLALRVGTMIGGFGLGAAKVTTLSSLELGRGIIEGILSRAGTDVTARSRGELGKADAETLLEQSLESLHRTMTQIVFWTATGFEVTGTTVSIASEMSQLLLSSLDQFFGSTDSSRAIASIITLIRREFDNPATGVPGEKVGVVDLVFGICGLAFLQRSCRRSIDGDIRRLRTEEVVWDVVVLNERVDVHEESLYGTHAGTRIPRNSSSDRQLLHDGSANLQFVTTLQAQGVDDSTDDDGDLPEIALRRQIIQSLPGDAQVSITTSISTTKTITVDVTGNQSFPLSPPPGVELVEVGNGQQYASRDGATLPSYRVVYRVTRNREATAHIRGEEDQSQPSGFVEQLEVDNGDSSDLLRREAIMPPPPVPPKGSTEKIENAKKRTVSSSNSSISPGPGDALSKRHSENAANQKRPRTPLTPLAPPSLPNSNQVPTRKQPLNRTVLGKRKDDPLPPSKQAEKKGGFRSAFRKGTVPAISNLLHKEDTGSESYASGARGKQKSATSSANASKGKPIQTKGSKDATPGGIPSRASSLVPKREGAPLVRKQDGSGRPTVSQIARNFEEPFPRSSSRASHVSIHERRRDSIVSQTDTYALLSVDTGRPVSPTLRRTEVISGTSMMKSRSEKDMTDSRLQPPRNHYRRATSHTPSPSIYTLNTNGSESSLVPYSYYRRSPYSEAEALATLQRTGMVEGMFPKYHLLRNLCRYMRFSSASYGSSFLKFMGIAKEMHTLRFPDDTHRELRWFAHHTQSNTDSILLSSFVDPQGGSDSTGSTNTGVPLVHYVSLDHESKAVVLSCRGTLGFEDVLADMTCDYDDLTWRGKAYKVHKGIHASAQRLLYGGDGRVLITLKQALEEFSDYGLVLTGHSLGGAVTALLGVMLSEPASSGTCFITSPQPHSRLLAAAGVDTTQHQGHCHISLPSGRPIHVYAYGPPATMSTALCRATRGLVTSVVNGNDLVPYLSLGVLHDLQAVALAFKTDNNAAKAEVRQRIWDAFQTGIVSQWRGRGAEPSRDLGVGDEEDDEEGQWAYAAYKILRSSMMSRKLLPPGEVFLVESTPVLRRDAFMASTGGSAERSEHAGRPARRVVLKYVRDVEERFREVRFGTGMLTDHNPGSYEDALDRLSTGALGGVRMDGVPDGRGGAF